MRIGTRISGLGSSVLSRAVERLRERIARDRRPVMNGRLPDAVPPGDGVKRNASVGVDVREG